MITNDWMRLKEGAYLSPNKKMLVLKVREALRFKNSFPPDKCVTAPYQQNHLVGIPYQMDSLQMLRNLNCDTRGIELLRHTFTLPLVEQQYPLMPHQVATASFLSENRRAFCTSTMRTGKTASAVVAARFLQTKRLAGGCLCIATKTNLRGVWEKEIKGMYPDATVLVIHDKDPRKRRALLHQDADFYIVNYDGIKIVKDELIAAVDSGRITVAIVDELTHYANSQNQLWDVADQVINGTRWIVSPGRRFRGADGGMKEGKPRRRRAAPGRPLEYVWGLTGTPGDPEMVYGQVKLVAPDKMNMSFVTWRNMTMVAFGFKWVPRVGYKDQIFTFMQPCIRFDKKDIMSLPPVTNQGADADMSAPQQKLYKAVQQDMLALMESGEEIKAPTKAALVFKLLQVAQGAVKAEDGKIISLDVKSRIDNLEELIKTASQKVVIFCAFTAVIDMLEKQLTERGYTVGVVDGRVTGSKRDEVFRQFQEEKDPHVILCHPRTTAFGVELAAADTMIFYGPPLSGEFVYQQAIERMSSLKQRAASIQIIQQSACREERKLFNNIKLGVSINESINDMFTVDPNNV